MGSKNRIAVIRVVARNIAVIVHIQSIVRIARILNFS